MSENWIYDQLRDKTIAAHNGDLGVLSTSEHLAAALVLNRPDWLEDAGYTMVGAITRVGEAWLAQLPQLERDLKDEGLI